MTGSVGRFLFGGSTQEAKSQQGPVDVTPPELSRLREPFAQTLERLLGARGGDPLAGVPQAPGPLAAPLGGNEAALLERLMGEGAGRSDLLSRTIGGEFLRPDTNPFLQSMIEAAQRPTLQGLEETLSRVLPGRFTGAGQFVQPQGSSAFDRAAAIASRGAADALADIATNISGAAFEAERGRQQEAITLSQQDVQATVQNLQAQALPRLIEQLGIDKGLEQFQQRIAAVLQALSLLTGGQITNIAQQGTSTSTGETQGSVVSALLPKGFATPFGLGPKGGQTITIG